MDAFALRFLAGGSTCLEVYTNRQYSFLKLVGSQSLLVLKRHQKLKVHPCVKEVACLMLIEERHSKLCSLLNR